MAQLSTGILRSMSKIIRFARRRLPLPDAITVRQLQGQHGERLRLKPSTLRGWLTRRKTNGLETRFNATAKLYPYRSGRLLVNLARFEAWMRSSGRFATRGTKSRKGETEARHSPPGSRDVPVTQVRGDGDDQRTP